MMAVWLVRVPISVTNARTGSFTIPAVSAGERSRATTMDGASRRGTICFGVSRQLTQQAIARRTRRRASARRCRRRCRGLGGPEASWRSRRTPERRAHSAHFFSSRMCRSTRSRSSGSPIIIRYASRIAFVSSGAPSGARSPRGACCCAASTAFFSRASSPSMRRVDVAARIRRLDVADDERRPDRDARAPAMPLSEMP